MQVVWGLTDNTGNGLTLIVPVRFTVQPVVTAVTVYVVVLTGDCVKEAVEAPVFQVYEVPPLAVIVPFCPAHIVVAVTLTLGKAFTRIVCTTVLAQLFKSVNV